MARGGRADRRRLALAPPNSFPQILQKPFGSDGVNGGLAIKLPNPVASPFDGQTVQLSLNLDLLLKFLSSHSQLPITDNNILL